MNFENGKSLDPAIFDDGFRGASDKISKFFVRSPTDPAYFDREITIEYILSLADYPLRQVSNVFKVKFTVLDWCDPKILEFLEYSPLSCLQDEADDKKESSTEDNDDDDVKTPEEDESSKDDISAESNNSTQRLINEPEWF